MLHSFPRGIFGGFGRMENAQGLYSLGHLPECNFSAVLQQSEQQNYGAVQQTSKDLISVCFQQRKVPHQCLK